MIGYLKGKIHSKSETHVVVDVQGVGYEVYLSKMSLATIGGPGSEVGLEIHTHFTESNLQLYGFLSTEEKMIFKKMISVSGIGPKIGLSIVGAYPFEHLVSSIIQGDLDALTHISGIGKKTAERIVMELKDKFKTLDIARIKPFSGVEISGDRRLDDALQALLSLGYSENVARKALQKLALAGDDTVQSLIKKSLGAMSS